MKYKSYREVMQAMNAGEMPRNYIGPKNFHILKQELFSLKNQYKPKSFTPSELEKMNEKIRNCVLQIERLPSYERVRLVKDVDEMLGKF